MELREAWRARHKETELFARQDGGDGPWSRGNDRRRDAPSFEPQRSVARNPCRSAVVANLGEDIEEAADAECSVGSRCDLGLSQRLLRRALAEHESCGRIASVAHKHLGIEDLSRAFIEAASCFDLHVNRSAGRMCHTSVDHSKVGLGLVVVVSLFREPDCEPIRERLGRNFGEDIEERNRRAVGEVQTASIRCWRKGLVGGEGRHGGFDLIHGGKHAESDGLVRGFPRQTAIDAYFGEDVEEAADAECSVGLVNDGRAAERCFRRAFAEHHAGRQRSAGD